MGEMLWRLCRPVVALAVFSGVSLTLATLLMQLAKAGSQLLLTVATLLAGAALLAGILAATEFSLALLAWKRWLDGGGTRCPQCDAPWSPSIVWPDRCVNAPQRCGRRGGPT